MLLGPLSTAFPARHSGSGTLVDAAVKGDAGQVRQLISQGAEVDATDPASRTALFYAAEKGHTDVVEVLIRAGANLNAKDNLGNTPLHFAAVQGHIEVCRLLLDGGADANAKNLTGGTPAAMARVGGHDQIVELLDRQEAYSHPAGRPGRGTPRPGRGGTNGSADPEAETRRGGRGYEEYTSRDSRHTTESDPIADPNAVIAGIKAFKGLVEELAKVHGRSKSEIRGWLNVRRGNNRIDLAKAVNRQIRSEYVFLAEIAVAESAATTKEAFDTLLTCRLERVNRLSKEIQEQIRGPRRTRSARGGYGGRSTRGYGGRSGRQSLITGSAAGRNAETAATRPKIRPIKGLAQEFVQTWEKVNLDAEDELDEWLQTKPEAKAGLAKAVYDQAETELVFARKLALQEKAKKTTAAIEGVMLDRRRRLTELTKAIEELTKPPEQNRDPRGGGYGGSGFGGGYGGATSPTQQQQYNQPGYRRR